MAQQHDLAHSLAAPSPDVDEAPSTGSKAFIITSPSIGCTSSLVDCLGRIWAVMVQTASAFHQPKQMTPAELIRQLKDNSVILMRPPKQLSPKVRDRLSEETSKVLHQLKVIFTGSPVKCRCSDNYANIVDQELNLELIAELSQEAYSQGLLEILCEALEHYDFEARKGAVIVFNGLLRRQIGSRWPTVEYISRHHSILWTLLDG